ncbi:MAG TPA: hypothetical protein VGE08_15370 [Steroidobacter sp.]
MHKIDYKSIGLQNFNYGRMPALGYAPGISKSSAVMIALRGSAALPNRFILKGAMLVATWFDDPRRPHSRSGSPRLISTQLFANNTSRCIYAAATSGEGEANLD